MKSYLSLSSISKPTSIVILMIVAFVIVNNILFYPTNTISYDVFGYYLYLPLTFFVDGDSQDALNYLQEIKATYSSSETLYQIQHLPNGDFVIKYTSGWAACYAPFFFIAHSFALMTSYSADGFSQPYQTAVFLGSVFYSLTGLYFLIKIACYYFRLKLALLLVTLIILGTNYLLHITMYGQSAMTHNLLFTGYTVIIWLTIKWYNERKLITILALGVVCGLVILTRPTEIVCLLIPLLWPIHTDEKRIVLFRNHLKQLIIFTVIIILIGSIQLLYWKVKTGHYLFFDYGNPAEGLDFLTPHTLDTLFSFRKGWYIYTPLILLATLGFITLYKKNRKLFVPLFTFFIINLYLVSSWSCWWYATSFSQRALIPSMVIMIIPLGYLVRFLWKQKLLIRTVFAIVLTFIVFLNIFQTIQYYQGVIPGDRMTKQYYFASFGSLSPNEKLKEDLLLIDRKHPERIDFTDESKYSTRTLFETSFEDHQGSNSTMFVSGEKSLELSSDNIYSPPFKFAYQEITKMDHAFIRITAKVFKTKQENDSPTLLTASFEYQNATYKWENVSLQSLPVGKWSEIEMIYLTPETRTEKDELNVHFWHRHDQMIYLDDLKIEVFEPK